MGFFSKYWTAICTGLIKTGLKKVAKRVVTAAAITALGLSAAAASVALIGVTATVGAVVGAGTQCLKAHREGRTADWKELATAGVIGAASTLAAELLLPGVIALIPPGVVTAVIPSDLIMVDGWCSNLAECATPTPIEEFVEIIAA